MFMTRVLPAPRLPRCPRKCKCSTLSGTCSVPCARLPKEHNETFPTLGGPDSYLSCRRTRILAEPLEIIPPPCCRSHLFPRLDSSARLRLDSIHYHAAHGGRCV